MKKGTNKFLVAIMFLLVLSFYKPFAQAQTQPYGIWSAAASSTNFVYNDVRGAMVTVKWSDLQANITDAINWNKLDNKLAANGNTNNTVLLVWVWVDGNGGAFAAPPNGVPVVPLYDCSTNTFVGNGPDYTNNQFKNYFKTMITQVEQHIMSQRSTNPIYQKIIAVQACLGSTGDYPSYKGECNGSGVTIADPPVTYFYEMSQSYDQAYSGTPIHVIHNPGNNFTTQLQWVLGIPDPSYPSYLPPTHPWLKMGDVGHGYQLNGEEDYYTSLNPAQKIFAPLNGEYVRSRSEMATDVTSSGWWTSTSDPGRKYRNMLALLASAGYFGLDMSNQLPGSPNDLNEGLMDAGNQQAYNFYNRNASLKDPVVANNAYCLLRDGLDASNTTRFSETQYGQYKKSTMITRFTNIMNDFSSHGARLDDPTDAVGGSASNRAATGINDVGDRIIESNYERYVTQLPTLTNGVPDPIYNSCDGWWNQAYPNADGSLSCYGRFAKSIKDVTGKRAMYFDIDNSFLSGYTGNLTFTITYLDNGAGNFWYLKHRNTAGTQIVSETSAIKNSQSPVWKQQTFILPAADFTKVGSIDNRNKCANNSDFFLQTKSTNGTTNEEDMFALIEVTKTGSSFQKSKNSTANASALIISPNPTDDHFTIVLSGKKQMSSVSIFSENGRIVFTKKINATTLVVNKNEIGGTPGIYYVTVTDNNNKKFSSIIKITE